MNEGDRFKVWLSAAEIAACALHGLPQTKRGVQLFAARSGWDGNPRLTKARSGHGGGSEYHLDILPPAARADYVSRQIGIVSVPASIARDAAVDPASAALPGAAADSRDARLAILALADKLAAEAKLSRKRADFHFCDKYNSGGLQIAGWITSEIKSLTPRTLTRWRKIKREIGASRLGVDRSAARKGTGILDRANGGEVKTYILALLAKQPQLTAHHVRALTADRFSAIMIGDIAVSLPPIRTFQHALKAWRSSYRNALEAVRNPDGFKSAIRFSARVAQPAAHLNEVWQIDASPADMLCTDGRNSLYVAVDIYSRRLIGLVSRTPRAEAVGLLIRKAILQWGVPERIKTDNGSDFIARDTKRLFAGLAIEHETARAFSPEQKGHVERAIGTLQRGLMRTLEGFIGHSVADRKVIENRKSFAARLGETAEDMFQVALSAAELQQRVDDWCSVVYANQPHSALKGATPFAAAAMAAGPIRKIEDVRALDMLLAPVAGKDGLRTVTKSGIRVGGAYYLAGFLEVGDTVFVRMDPADMGRAYVYDAAGRAYLGEAMSPDLAGIDPAAAIAAARAEQKRIITGRMADARAEARKIKASDMASAIVRQAALAAGKIAEFPKRIEFHDTPSLAAARQVNERHETGHSAEIAELAKQMRADEASAFNVRPLRSEETAHQRWKRARDLEAALERGEFVDPEQLLWLGGYREGPEYRGFAMTYGVAETKRPATDGIGAGQR
jgi:putative transposase